MNRATGTQNFKGLKTEQHTKQGSDHPTAKRVKLPYQAIDYINHAVKITQAFRRVVDVQYPGGILCRSKALKDWWSDIKRRQLIQLVSQVQNLKQYLKCPSFLRLSWKQYIWTQYSIYQIKQWKGINICIDTYTWKTQNIHILLCYKVQIHKCEEHFCWGIKT